MRVGTPLTAFSMPGAGRDASEGVQDLPLSPTGEPAWHLGRVSETGARVGRRARECFAHVTEDGH